MPRHLHVVRTREPEPDGRPEPPDPPADPRDEALDRDLRRLFRHYGAGPTSDRLLDLADAIEHCCGSIGWAKMRH